MAQLLIFRSGEERIALPAQDVREVVPLGRLTRVPHAPPALLGLGNVRGTVMPMVSVDALLDKPSSVGRQIIVLDRDEPIGLVVTDIPRLADETDARSIDLGALLDRSFVPGDRPSARVPDLIAASRRLNPAAAGVAEEHTALLAFIVGAQIFALPLEQVDELIALPGDIELLPGADQVALGSITYRGALLPLLSLHALLALADRGSPAKPRIVVARIKGARVGLVVDALDAILRVTDAAIDPLPLVLSRGNAEAKIQAIVRRDGGRGLVSLLATDHLLNEALMSRLQDDKGARAHSAPASPEPVERLLLFRLGEEVFGLPVAAVREVVAMPERLTRLPLAPAFVAGVMNLRGRTIPVIDQRQRFEVTGESPARRRVIIAALDDLEAGFVVDSVSEVLSVPASRLAAAPEMGEGTRVFDRVANVDGGGRMVLVIEPRELLDRAERDLLAALPDGEAAAQP